MDVIQTLVISVHATFRMEERWTIKQSKIFYDS